MYEIVGKSYGGNTIGRDFHAKRVVSGAKAGTSYTFSHTYKQGSFGSGMGLVTMEAKCYPV